ncbi:MAG: hypothetical protein HQL64_11135 [Magnetococcales bacterium]|nr:hypothetical protein [Magnetococcales bacterium]
MTISNVGRGAGAGVGIGIAIALSLLLVSPVQADLYTCKDNKTSETVWRNRPCSGNETLVRKESVAAPRKEPPAASAPPDASQTAHGNQADTPASASQTDSLMKYAGQQATSTIASDPRLMQRVMELQNDPSFRSVLNDKDLIAKIQSGKGLEELANDPRIQKLMQHPMVQELKGRAPGP